MRVLVKVCSSSNSTFTNKEIVKFLDDEQKALVFKQTVHKYTNTCWYGLELQIDHVRRDKCIGKIKSEMDPLDAQCIKNCVGRFLDSAEYLLENLK